jgi:hypothetical protein
MVASRGRSETLGDFGDSRVVAMINWVHPALRSSAHELGTGLPRSTSAKHGWSSGDDQSQSRNSEIQFSFDPSHDHLDPCLPKPPRNPSRGPYQRRNLQKIVTSNKDLVEMGIRVIPKTATATVLRMDPPKTMQMHPGSLNGWPTMIQYTSKRKYQFKNILHNW